MTMDTKIKNTKPPALTGDDDPAERIRARLAYLYGDEIGEETAGRVFRTLETHKQLPGRSVVGPLWTHRDIVLITYGDSLQSPAQPPLQTLRIFLKSHLANAFSMVHLLPFYPWSSDGGFSVTDFRSVNPELGSWQDIAALEEDYDLVFDLVLNHCSRENLWFIDYIAGQEPACNYFIEVEDDVNLSMVTRPRSSTVLSGVRTRRGMRHVWTTFSNDQIDMNYANPDVLIEFIDILLYYFRRGARMLRLDAVAFLWKEIGTSCIHLPQTHQVIKLFRDILELVEPAGLLMTETNVPHQENITYFGQGDEAHLVYQFSLPPLLLHAVYTGKTGYLKAWAKSLETTDLPDNCTFFNFTASHDGVGLRPLEGLVPDEEIAALLEGMRARGGYISTRRNSDGLDTPYELNISYFDAFRSNNPDTEDYHVESFMLTQAVALSFKGIPAVYIHSLLAAPNDTLGVERTGMTRAVNRRQWDRGELEALIARPDSENHRVLQAYKSLLWLRKRQLAFHPDAAQQVLDLPDGLFGLHRIAVDHSQDILCLYNCTAETIELEADQLPVALAGREELMGHAGIRLVETGGLRLRPYAAAWLSATR